MRGMAWRVPLLRVTLHCSTLMTLLPLHSQLMACQVTSLMLASSMHASTGTKQLYAVF